MKQLFFISLIVVKMTTAVAQQSNFAFSYTHSTVAAPYKIWQIWTDVPNWKQWDTGMKEAKLNGNFVVGATGELLPDKGPTSKFIITELEVNKSYSFKTKIPFGWLIIKRSLEVKDGKTFFTHDVKFTGFLKKIIGNKIGKKYRAMLPAVLFEIKKIAESNGAN